MDMGDVIMLVAVLGMGYFQMRTKASIETIGEKAAEKVAETKQTLQVTSQVVVGKLDSIATTTDKVHELVNSGNLIQLRLHATVTRRLAEITKDPHDIKAAEAAEKLHREHEEKQKMADAKTERRGA